MSYYRILPRDAFNDANLLKCMAKLTMLIEDGKIPWLTFTYDNKPFNIQQNPHDGNTYVANISIYCKHDDAGPLILTRPMNSREPWPLYIESEHGGVFPVFSAEGEFILGDEERAALTASVYF